MTKEELGQLEIRRPSKEIKKQVQANWDAVAKPLDGLGAFEELTAKGQKVDFNEVLRDIEKRDHDDMTRALNPLRKAEDAVEIDTTGLSIDEVIERVLKEIK